MKNIYKTFLKSCILFLILGTSLASCEDYLDKEPDSTISGDDAFKNFMNFQGYIEEIYNCIPDKQKCNWAPSWNWGDDEIFNPEADSRMTHQVDLGNYRAWRSAGDWLYNSNSSSTATGDGSPKRHSLWPHAWYCISKANEGLANLDKLTTATAEEKNLIAGQLYFFRAWWHFELMTFFGGLPYVDHVLDATGTLTLPRLSYQECSDKVAADFRQAADLLPIDWDNTTVGKNTVGKNQLRINKIMALGYLGKNYLWAGSPLMKNGPKVGGSQTYDYDEAYCKKAAEAFGELLNLVEGNQTQYALAQFNYKDIYNHERAEGSTSSYSDIFYTTRQNWLQPGSVEAIFRGPSPDFNASNWNTAKVFGPKVAGLVAHDNVIHQPTANYVNMYGMDNGLPLNDPASGFDPNYPFKNRDPRFYHDIVFDGFKYVNSTMPADMEYLRYCSLYTGGAMRPVANASRTGYFIQKLVPHTCNEYDRTYDWGANYHCYLPYMRLSDIYLMYAESCAAFGGASGKSSNFSKTAEGAINTVRDRVKAGHVGSSYTASKNKFIDEISRERAVELSFEGFRFNDLQRWLLLTEYPYTVKTSQEFKRVENNDFFKNNDPKDARVSEFKEEVILTRVFGTKHYWFPLPDNDVYLYPEFGQNPGW
ncbi:RagB/SusD family nutrient uptake outer membrane protein [Dysgonomonas sp.]|uniref:RagB/SusD family nutrient uptake outer membrane protein n=1 Tax=Dysgonomonas sp. TaxID=1891233 RepID=UPI0028A7D94A|nr:RagB/SusD family nutrient uptake outer membrane protein [Dysgonomonas sp.]